MRDGYQGPLSFAGDFNEILHSQERSTEPTTFNTMGYFLILLIIPP